MTRETGSDPSQDQQEQKEQIVDKLEQYLQKIEAGKSDQVIADIVRVQGEYVDQRVELTDEQGEEIKQLAIEFIKRLSALDLEKLVREPWLVASMYERERDEGLGDADSIHGEGERFQKSDNPYMRDEASAKLVFLAYATQILGEFQEEFLQEYLSNRGGLGSYSRFSPQERDIKYIVHDENGTIEDGEFKGANPAFVKFTEQYRQVWERSQKLRVASLEFRGLIRDPNSQNSPVYDKANKLGSFYHDWRSGIEEYFKTGVDGRTLGGLGGRENFAPFLYNRSFGPGASYSYSVREVDEQGVVHLDMKRETK